MGGHSEVTQAHIYALCDSRITDPVARIRYIGQTRIALTRRLIRHWITALAGAKEHRAVWMRSMKGSGGEVLIELIETVPSAHADTAESECIARVRARGADLTNRTDGGRGRRGWEISPETRQKMRNSASKRRASLATRRKMSDAIKASVRHREHRDRLHQFNTGAKRSLETRARIRRGVSGEQNGHAVMTWHTASAIRQRYADGTKQVHLARDFNCSPATIHAIVRQQRWVPV